MKKLVYSFLLLVWFLCPNKCFALSIEEINMGIANYWSYQSRTQKNEVSICAPIFTPKVTQLPILKVKLYQLSESNSCNISDDVDSRHLNYSTLINFNFSNRAAISERVGRPYSSVVYENLWQDESDISSEYAEKQDKSLGEIVEKYNWIFNALLDEERITAIPLHAWIETPFLKVKPGTYEYEEAAQFPNQFEYLTGVGGYSIEYWPAIRNIPVIMGHDLAYSGPNKTPLQRRLSGDSKLLVDLFYSEDLWSFGGKMIWKETGVYSEDYALCGFEKIEETLMKLIEEGKIKDVFSIVLGYVVYADPTIKYKNKDEQVSVQEFVAIPTWVIEALYTENPNREFTVLPPSGDPTVYTYTSHIGYQILNISAQTGELYDPSDATKDRVYSKDKWQ